MKDGEVADSGKGGEDSDVSIQIVAGSSLGCSVNGGYLGGQLCNWSITATENITYSNVKV
nr:hypothetical protein [Evansella caseinilytica]